MAPTYFGGNPGRVSGINGKTCKKRLPGKPGTTPRHVLFGGPPPPPFRATKAAADEARDIVLHDMHAPMIVRDAAAAIITSYETGTLLNKVHVSLCLEYLRKRDHEQNRFGK